MVYDLHLIAINIEGYTPVIKNLCQDVFYFYA